MSDDMLDSDLFKGIVSIPLNNPPVNVYAALSIGKDSLKPTQINQLLGLQPTKCYCMGDINLLSKRVETEGFWSLTSEHMGSENSVSKHLLWILDRLVGKEKLLSQLVAEGYTVAITCRCGIAHWNTFFSLERDVVLSLANLNMPISFDLYDEEEDED